MKNNEFNDILKKRASDFKLTPSNDTFNAIITKRETNLKRTLLLNNKALALLLVTLIVANKLNNNIEFQLNNNNILSLQNQIIENNFLNKDDNKAILNEKKSKINEANKAAIVDNSNKHIQSENGSKSNKAIIKKDKVTLIENYTNEVEIINDNNIIKSYNLVTEPMPIEGKDLTKLIVKDSILNTEKVIDVPLLISNNINSPDSIVSKKVKTKSKIGFEFSLINQYMLGNWAYNGANNSVIENDFGIKYNEKANSSNAFGFLVGLSLNKWSFLTGLNYNVVDFDKLYIEENSTKNVSSKTEFLNDFGYKVNVIDQSLVFYEFPFLVGYKMGDKKLSLNIETGVSYLILNRTNTYSLTGFNNAVFYNTINDKNNLRFESNQFVFTISANAQYALSKHINIFLGPIVKANFKQYYKYEFTNRNAPIFVGINSGIKFNF